MYTNIDCFMNKKAEFETVITEHKSDVIGITEMKPKNLRYDVQEVEI